VDINIKKEIPFGISFLTKFLLKIYYINEEIKPKLIEEIL